MKIWFQNRRARARRDQNDGHQEVQNAINNQRRNISLQGLKSAKETFVPTEHKSLPQIEHNNPQEKYLLKRIPEVNENTLQMLKSSSQLTPCVPSYLPQGLVPSHLPWLRPAENPFLSQRTLGLFNR